MGANQSSAGGASAQGTAEIKTSYYELLGVDRQASDDEIKKAYRRKALELHPDRNYGNVEHATALFAEVQSAYEVLSDPQERAWYDSHESAILRGADAAGGTGTEAHYEHNIRVTTADDITRMMRKFHGKIDFSDSPSGFFGFLRETFATLAREEAVAAEMEGVEGVDYPDFGHKDDAYEDVVKGFYAVWSGFSTRKSFAWKDIYRYSEAPDRRYRRMMEKENKRLRDEGIKEFNDTVRTLVAFVRKRDPRYTPNTQTEAERQKALREAAAAQAARSRAANEAKMREHVPEWTKVRQPEEVEESEEEEIEEEHFECVACQKTFKSEKQFDAHEKSKKHQKAVQALKRKMQRENTNLNLDEDLSSSGIATPASAQDGEDLDAEDAQEHSDNKDEEIDKDLLNGMEELDADHDAITDSTQLKEAHNIQEQDNEEDPDTNSDSDYAPRSKINARLSNNANSDTNPDLPPGPEKPSSTTAPSEPKLGKAAQKRAKRAAQAVTAEQAELKFKCAACGAAFPSKTRMFQHIKDFGHAAPVSVTRGGKGGAKGKRK